MDTLIRLFSQGRYPEAADLAGTMTARFPRHGFGWKVWGVALQQLGRGEDALASLQKAAALMPGDADAHINLAVALHECRRLADAEASFKAALGIKPHFVEAHYCLGNTLRDLGRLQEAESSYRAALQTRPDFAEAHGNLGFILQQSGRLVEAEASYRRVLEIMSDDAESHYNLGNILRDLARPDEAAAAYRQAVEIDPRLADAYCNLGAILSAMGQLDKALAHYRQAVVVSPSLHAARMGLSVTLSRLVPHWHVPMMNDRRRNSAYFAALESAIAPDSEVFEIGTGAGLVAMMAAKLGAKRVTTCEAVPLIAAAAQRIVAENGYANSVKVIPRRSVDIDVGDDLGGKADILVAEIFSSELLGEHVLPSIEDAKRRLLKPQGRVVPAAGSIMVALFGDGELARNLVVDNTLDFDLQHFNALISEKQVTARTDLNVAMLSDDIEAFRFEFQRDDSFPGQTRSLDIPVKAAGRCYGIIQWIRLQMTDAIRFENHPSEHAPVSNWQYCTYVFAQPLDVRPGQIAVVSASHNRIVPWFSLDRIRDS